MLNDFLKTIGPMVAAAIAEKAEFRFENHEGDLGERFERHRGRKLEELDLTVDAPSRLAVMGATRVSVREGKTFRVAATGDAADGLRFTQDDDNLAVMLQNGSGEAHVEITMPAPRAVSVAGSASVELETLAATAKVTLAGSGRIAIDRLDSDLFKASLMGSGRLQASGRAKQAKIAITGSGSADCAFLDAEEVRIAQTGSGSVRIACDGEVRAKLAGSGSATVYGRARIRVRSMGSGEILCEPLEARGERTRGGGGSSAPDAPTPPRPPKPPKPPKQGGAAAKPEVRKPGKRQARGNIASEN